MSHDEASKREAAAPASDNPRVNKARRCFLRGEKLREEDMTTFFEQLKQYDKGISVLEEGPSFEDDEEAVRLMVSLKDIRSTCLHMSIRCGLDPMASMMYGGAMGADAGNQNMAEKCSQIISDCAYVLDRREHATVFQIQKGRSKRMHCAIVLETKLGSDQSVTQHEREMALEDASAVFNEEDTAYGVTWGNDCRDMALDTRLAMGVANHGICANVKCEKNRINQTPPSCACENLQLCSRCKSVRYCSTACQRKHWKEGGHNIVCKKIVAKNNLVLVD